MSRLPNGARAANTYRHTRCAPRRHRVAAGLIVLALAGPSGAAAQMLNFRQYTIADGLPQSQVMGIRQDRLGYLWFATYGGLSRFDGNVFRTFTKEDGLSANSVFDVVEDRDGRLVIATAGGLCIRAAERFECLGQREGLVSDNARSVAVDKRGGIWVGTLRGLSLVQGGTIRNYTVADGLPSDRVIRVVADSAGRVWVATASGLVRHDGARFVRDTHRMPGDTAVHFIAPAGTGVLVGVEGHLYLRQADTVRPVAEGAIPAGTAFVDGAVDRDGTIWVATRSGVLRIRDGQVDRIGKANGLLSEMVVRVMIDREGDVWFGTESGASKHVPGPFRTYTTEEGLPSPFVRDMALDERGRLWVGTRNGVAIREGERFRAVQMPAVPDNRVFGMARAPEGGMLIGTRRGLIWYREGRVRVFGEAEGIPGEAVYCLLPDGRGGVWIGTERGLARWEAGRIRRAGLGAVTGPGVISMARDRHGRLWMGRVAGGVAVLDRDSVRVIGPAEGGSDQTVWDLQEDSRGRMWAATNGDGALRIDGTHVRRFTTHDGLASNFVWQVLGDSRGSVWLFGNRGLDRFVGETLTHYGRGNGLIDLEGTASASFEDREGSLWFGTGVGLVRYTPDLDVAPHPRPPIFLEEATLDGTPVPLAPAGGVTRVRRGAVRFGFSSPTFRNESAIRFRYRLVGSSDAWSSASPDRSVTYAGLAPGRYRFEVVSANGPAVSAAPATVTFDVLPAYWQTWWFRLLGTVLLLGGAAAIPLVRARSLERERRRLEALVAHHTRELAEKNLRLETSNRDLEHFAYVASHDLQEPLRKIQAFSDRVTKQYAAALDSQGRDYLERMNAAAARMQRLINALLGLSRITTKKKDAEPIELGPLMQEVLGDLEVRIQSTGGRVEVGELPRIEGDPTQIRQLLQNLVANALKFHRPGEPPVVAVSAARRAPGVVELSVADNGIGFEQADAGRVFLPFNRLHGRSEYEGTGIGLTICQKIAEGHGGAIRAESTPGHGARFVVTLPVHERIGEQHAA